MKTFGQNERVSSAPMPEPITKTIVRHYQNDEVIGYVQTTRNSYFTLSDAQSYNKVFSIDPKYIVNDIKIEDNIAYFCGRNTITNTGIIGHFDVNDFFSGVDGYYILDNLPTNTPGVVDNLTRLDLFHNRNGLNVTAIGFEPTYTYPISCIINFLPWSTSGINYYAGTIDPSQASQFSFLDITHTDNYVVVSDMMNLSRIPSLRVFDINNFLTPGGIHDYSYAFGEFLDDMVYNYDDLLIEHLQSDFVVTATYWRYIYSTALYDGTNFCVFDINQMLSVPFSGMVYSFGMHQPYSSGYWDLHELCNSPGRPTLLLLQRADEPSSPSGIANMVSEIDFSSFPPSNPVRGTFLRHDNLSSLDLFNGTSDFIAIGNEYAYPQKLKYFRRTTFHTGYCSEPVQHTYSNYSISRNKKVDSPLSIMKSRLSTARQLPIKKTEESIDIDCEQ